MVIIVSKEGQIANRLWHYSNFMVNAIAHNYSLVHLHFNEYESYFSESIERNKHVFPVRTRLFRNELLNTIFKKIFIALVKVSRKTGWRNYFFFHVLINDEYQQGAKEIDLNSIELVKAFTKKTVLVSGWLFKDRVHMKKQQEMLSNFWEPNQSILLPLKKKITDLKSTADIVVGLHIRRGDYKYFNNGSWYYDVETYKTRMAEFCSLAAGKKVHFIVCTNEKYEVTDFKGFHVSIDQRNFIDDLFLLSMCDFIMGPPSTFSMWASYYGKVPLFKMQHVDDCIDSLTTFKIIEQ